MPPTYSRYLVFALLALSCEGGNKDDNDPTSTADEGVTATGASVVERNNSPNRNGVFVQPTLTRARAATMVLDRTFDGTVSGNVFASPLFVDGTPGVFVIATENNQISVLNETTGRPVWQRTYGTPAGRTGAGCGNISPLGITGTPVIDPAKRTIYFDAATGTTTTITDHLIHAVSLDDGSERPGWPVSSKSVSDGGERFNPVLHNQRSALALVNGILYVSYSGHLGDCGNYRGWLFGIDTSTPTNIRTFKTGATRGGGRRRSDQLALRSARLPYAARRLEGAARRAAPHMPSPAA
jgi:outer membrane protein assembly factor BamB